MKKTSTKTSAPKLSSYESEVQAGDLTLDQLKQLVGELIARQGLIIVKEATPDYQAVRLETRESIEE